MPTAPPAPRQNQRQHRHHRPGRSAQTVAAVATLALFLAAGAALYLRFRPPNPPTGSASPLRHDAYVWQRAWDGQVQTALRQHGTNFQRLIFLAAEVAWAGQQPRIVRVDLDYPALRQWGHPVGLALRVGPYSGPFSSNDATAAGLAGLARSLVHTAQTNGVPVSELHVDFDCAEARLSGYRQWLAALRQSLDPGEGPEPERSSSASRPALTITALPSWIRHREFGELVGATDGYVLQVHSLERPRDAAMPFTLCDPASARRWVREAARAGVDFSVALPTYGYGLTFDLAGHFLSLSAEGNEKIFSQPTIRREVSADPAAMAKLVRQWGAEHPTALLGVIWYRLPVPGDSLNWSWPAMSEVIAGRTPASHLTILRKANVSGLIEFGLTNAGPGDYLGTPVVRANWVRGRFVAGDAVRGFRMVDPGPAGDSIRFVGDGGLRLPAGDTHPVGWLRLEGAANLNSQLEEGR